MSRLRRGPLAACLLGVTGDEFTCLAALQRWVYSAPVGMCVWVCVGVVRGTEVMLYGMASLFGRSGRYGRSPRGESERERRRGGRGERESTGDRGCGGEGKGREGREGPFFSLHQDAKRVCPWQETGIRCVHTVHFDSCSRSRSRSLAEHAAPVTHSQADLARPSESLELTISVGRGDVRVAEARRSHARAPSTTMR